jgi:hypothetical protein
MALQWRLPSFQVIVTFIDKAAPSLQDALDRYAQAHSVVALQMLAPDEPGLSTGFVGALCSPSGSPKGAP